MILIDGDREVIKIKKLALSACITSTIALSGVTAVNASSESPNDWPQYHRTSDAWRYSPLDQINADNIDKLKVAWIHQPGDIQMQSSTSARSFAAF